MTVSPDPTGALPCQGIKALQQRNPPVPGVQRSKMFEWKHVRTFTRYRLAGFSGDHSKVPIIERKDDLMTSKPGAPKGNLNALKHGYYSRLFRVAETNDLPDETSSLQHEITLLRVMIRRTMELADGIDDLKEATRALDALGAAASRLASLLRAQKSLADKHSQMADEISIAIQQVNQELRRKK